jgi:signal transduction histidine kinase
VKKTISLPHFAPAKRIDHFQTIRLTKDRRPLDVSVTISPIKDKKGNIVGASKIARDITAQIRLQKQKDEFLGIASHELKTPVTSIKSFAQVLRLRFTKEGNETAAKLLGKLDAQVDKLTSLIGDLLDVTKIESGKMQFNDAYFSFDDMVAEIVEELQRTTEKHQLIIKGKTEKNIYADRERLGQVLTNLISNAIKYSPYTKDIIISPSAKDGTVKLLVQDFGVGISKDKQDKVFEQFFRVSGPGERNLPRSWVRIIYFQ